ncbi:MAG TPA: hypothetical protein PLH46_06170 [Caldisericia bacterium]|nr:hypothetical protein [Caldisericia bacterium]
MKEILINGRHDYNLIIEENVYSLYYSQDEGWTHPGALVLTLIDDGNGLVFKKFRKNGRFDYDEAVEVSVLLKAYYFLRGEKFEMVYSKIEL